MVAFEFITLAHEPLGVEFIALNLSVVHSPEVALGPKIFFEFFASK